MNELSTFFSAAWLGSGYNRRARPQQQLLIVIEAIKAIVECQTSLGQR